MVRELTPSFAKALWRWYSTVCLLMNSRTADFRIGEALGSEARDLRLLRGELATRFDGASAGMLAGRLQLDTCAVGKRLIPKPEKRSCAVRN